ncbi:DUF3619 domain-containing protein [Polynucleobacter tropicus]|uniref:DUF3619 domain-containing protein n=1 Tax=Polynucleobacter tropicus TaxID=1743174 RepID=A0A6M9PXH1_9BURK|nr:DUF3619 family protein [Polynucleobacter tropicus]QKM64592.1 DUF3619 domain-containing protein [Polynucleobacter tropicus]
MKHLDDTLSPVQADEFGRASAALLSQGAQSLPTSIKDRLYEARKKALAARKLEKVHIKTTALAGTSGNWAGSFKSSSNLWDTLGWVAPVVVLVFGLIGIAQWQNESRINDIAEVDAALLTDDVPPDAYADSGFMAFLKNGPLSDSEDSSSELSPSK